MKLTDKSDEELNVMLAELVGINPWRWKFGFQHENGWDEAVDYESFEEAEREWKGIYGGPTHADPIQKYAAPPRYCTDLNAVAEVERALTERQRIRYVEEVGKLAREEAASQGLDPRGMEDREVIFRHMTATARQRTIALIATLSTQ